MTVIHYGHPSFMHRHWADTWSMAAARHQAVLNGPAPAPVAPARAAAPGALAALGGLSVAQVVVVAVVAAAVGYGAYRLYRHLAR